LFPTKEESVTNGTAGGLESFLAQHFNSRRSREKKITLDYQHGGIAMEREFLCL